MILELHNGDRNELINHGDRITITYSHHSHIPGLIHGITEWETMSSLVIWGNHGNTNSMCGLRRDNIRHLLSLIPKDVRFRTIVLDACETACFTNEFVDRLTDDGAILCHAGIARGQVFQDGAVREEEIRQRWWELSIASMLQDREFGDAYHSATFPAIYRESCLTYYFEEGHYETSEDEANPFDEDSLEKILDIVRCFDIRIAESTWDVFIRGVF